MSKERTALSYFSSVESFEEDLNELYEINLKNGLGMLKIGIMFEQEDGEERFIIKNDLDDTIWIPLERAELIGQAIVEIIKNRK